MSHVMRKPVFGISDRFNTNGAVHPQRMARGFKLQMEVDGLYNLCSEIKGTDQLCITTQLICIFIFAYAKSRFSHDMAHMLTI